MNASDTKTTKDIKTAKAAKTKEHETRVAPRTHSQDLCSTCSISESCIHRSIGKPVFDCEEYELHPGVKAPAQPVYAEPERVTLQGLCVNCIHREGCTLAKTQGGVWHCEEYE